MVEVTLGYRQVVVSRACCALQVRVMAARSSLLRNCSAVPTSPVALNQCGVDRRVSANASDGRYGAHIWFQGMQLGKDGVAQYELL